MSDFGIARGAIAYYDLQSPHACWWELLKPGFQHCELFVPMYIGASIAAWVHLRQFWEGGEVAIHDRAVEDIVPHATIQYVENKWPRGRMHTPFAMGPVSCVTMVKAMMGFRAPLVFTPHQLFTHIEAAKAGGKYGGKFF